MIPEGYEAFSVEKALAGHEVMTKSHCEVRIICYDRHGSKPVIALVNTYNEDCYEDDDEALWEYDSDGRLYRDMYCSLDLVVKKDKK